MSRRPRPSAVLGTTGRAGDRPSRPVCIFPRMFCGGPEEYRENTWRKEYSMWHATTTDRRPSTVLFLSYNIYFHHHQWNRNLYTGQITACDRRPYYSFLTGQITACDTRWQSHRRPPTVDRHRTDYSMWDSTTIARFRSTEQQSARSGSSSDGKSDRQPGEQQSAWPGSSSDGKSGRQPGGQLGEQQSA